MIQLLPEPKMAEDFEKTTININAIYFCGELSDELRKLARERFWNYQDIKINEASEDTDTGHLKWKSILKLFSEMFRSRSGMQKTEGG